MPKPPNEEFYDTEIAPALLELAKKCDEREIPFAAIVHYGPEDMASTVNKAGHSSPGPLLTLYAAKANGNIDLLVISLARQKVPHSSMILTLAESGEKLREHIQKLKRALSSTLQVVSKRKYEKEGDGYYRLCRITDEEYEDYKKLTAEVV